MRKYEFQLMLLIIWYMFTLKANALGATQAIYSIPFKSKKNYLLYVKSILKNSSNLRLNYTLKRNFFLCFKYLM